MLLRLMLPSADRLSGAVTAIPPAVTRRIAELVAEYALPEDAAPRLAAMLAALAAEADPHTTVYDPRAAVDTHVADSLAGLNVAAVRSATAIVDIGAGPGFPGLPLAVALPHARVHLVESTGRKVAVIERLAGAARTVNARALHVRAEDWARDAGREAYEVATARAVAPLPVLVEYAGPLLGQGGLLVAWRGARNPRDEKAAAKVAGMVGLEPTDVLSVTPFEGARERHLHLYLKARPTPGSFPRRAGVALKRPLV